MNTKRNRLSYILLALLLTSCSKDIAYKGYSIDEDNLNKIIIGKSSMNDVLNILGSPTTSSLYKQTKFFYISHQYKSRFFSNPKLVNQKITEISFSKNNIAQAISTYSTNDMNSIKFATKQTELVGNKMNPFKQIIGNIGKYNESQDAKKPGT